MLYVDYIYIQYINRYIYFYYTPSSPWFPTPELFGEAFAVNEIGSSEWSEWSDELETHPFAPGPRGS